MPLYRPPYSAPVYRPSTMALGRWPYSAPVYRPYIGVRYRSVTYGVMLPIGNLARPPAPLPAGQSIKHSLYKAFLICCAAPRPKAKGPMSFASCLSPFKPRRRTIVMGQCTGLHKATQKATLGTRHSANALAQWPLALGRGDPHHRPAEFRTRRSSNMLRLRSTPIHENTQGPRQMAHPRKTAPHRIRDTVYRKNIR